MGHVKTRKPSPTKKSGGYVLKSLSESPTLVGTMLLGAAEQKVPLVKSCYMCGVFFLLHFYGSLFLMNGNLTFSLVEQDSIFFAAFQTSFAPSSCLFPHPPPHPCSKQTENPKRKPDETRTKQTNFLETEVLAS